MSGHVTFTTGPGGKLEMHGGDGTFYDTREEARLATRAREGARATFRWLEPALENEALLEDGAWIEDAVAAAVLL